MPCALLDAQIAATQETLKTRQDYLEIVRRRADAGLASDLDLNQAIGAASDAAAQLKELVRQRKLALHVLATLTGNLGLEVAAGDLSQLPVPPIPPTGLPSTLLERRPDIREAGGEPRRRERAYRRRAGGAPAAHIADRSARRRKRRVELDPQ